MSTNNLFLFIFPIVCAVKIPQCVVDWGNGFRDCYARLGELRAFLPGVPFCAFTATVNADALNHIIQSLNLNNPILTATCIDRPNVYYSVKRSTGDFWVDVSPHIILDGPIIIYVLTAHMVTRCINTLQELGFNCAGYYAPMSNEDRQNALTQFLDNQISIIVSTVACSMDIDNPNVCKVIHYGAPMSMDIYYHEAGRAGRNGYDAEVLTFFNEAHDRRIHNHFLQNDRDQAVNNPNRVEFARMQAEQNNIMWRFCLTDQCQMRCASVCS